jgi:hypothetical protein
LELTNESKPIEGLTKSNWNDSLFLIRGKDEGIPAWHHILVPYHQIQDLKNQQLIVINLELLFNIEIITNKFIHHQDGELILRINFKHGLKINIV